MTKTLADMTPEQQLTALTQSLEQWRNQLDKRIKFGDYLMGSSQQDIVTRTKITAILDGVTL